MAVHKSKSRCNSSSAKLSGSQPAVVNDDILSPRAVEASAGHAYVKQTLKKSGPDDAQTELPDTKCGEHKHKEMDHLNIFDRTGFLYQELLGQGAFGKVRKCYPKPVEEFKTPTKSVSGLTSKSSTAADSDSKSSPVQASKVIMLP